MPARTTVIECEQDKLGRRALASLSTAHVQHAPCNPCQFCLLAQVVFEEMGMQGLAVATGPDLVLRQHLKQSPQAPFHAAQAGLVVEAGFSFIHVVPFLDDQVGD